jgi:hypothetical protein
MGFGGFEFMDNTKVNRLRQMLCLPNTPALRYQVYQFCDCAYLFEMAVSVLPKLAEWETKNDVWIRRQRLIAESVKRNTRYREKGNKEARVRFHFGALNGLTEADLTNADLREADLSGADLTGAYYTVKTKFTGVRYDDDTKFMWEDFDPKTWGITRKYK